MYVDTLALIIDDISSLKIRFSTEVNRYAEREMALWWMDITDASPNSINDVVV